MNRAAGIDTQHDRTASNTLDFIDLLTHRSRRACKIKVHVKLRINGPFQLLSTTEI